MCTVGKITEERHFEMNNILKMLMQESYTYLLQLVWLRERRY
jgi:hypothetical protein